MYKLKFTKESNGELLNFDCSKKEDAERAIHQLCEQINGKYIFSSRKRDFAQGIIYSDLGGIPQYSFEISKFKQFYSPKEIVDELCKS